MLFDFENRKKDDEPSDGGSELFEGEQHFPKSVKLEDTLNLVKSGSIIHWVSEGDWSMHDLLTGLLGITGPADVFLSSYAFSEYPARLIADLKSRKIILDLHCLIDKRLDVRSASALAMIKNIATRLELVNTHAKVTVIENSDFMIVVIGSANYTTNKRYESGVIITDRSAALFHKNWMLNAFEKNRRTGRK